MPMEQISKLQEVLHLFKMESQDIFETKWLTQIALPFTDGSRKAFTHLVNTGLYKDNTKTQNTTSTTAKTQTSPRPTGQQHQQPQRWRQDPQQRRDTNTAAFTQRKIYERSYKRNRRDAIEWPQTPRSTSTPPRRPTRKPEAPRTSMMPAAK